MTQQESTDRFRPYLFSGERLLWSGQPKQGLVLLGRDALLIPFSLMWGGFAIFWNASVWALPIAGGPTSLLFRLWGLPFLVVGLYLIFGRFIHDAHIRKTVSYAVTNQRVLVLRGSRSPKITSLDIDRLPRLELSEHRGGAGTIAFEPNSIFANGTMNGFGLWTPALIGVTSSSGSKILAKCSSSFAVSRRPDPKRGRDRCPVPNQPPR